MKRIYLTIYIILLFISSKGQFNKNGYPLYTYYGNSDYNAYDQNWDVIEDENGIIYVANNNDGILQYDGETWRKIEIENKPEVRTLAIDNNGVIYVGCSNDFGYLLPNIEGDIVFNSLLKKFSHKDNEIPFIYKVNIVEDTVFFSSDNYLLFKYIVNQDTVIVSDLPQYTLFTFAVNNQLYGSGYLDGLFEKSGDTVATVLGGEFYKSKNIFSILPDTNSLIVVTGQQGIYNYNLSEGISSQLLTKNSSEFLKEFITYSAIKNKENVLLATIGSGVVGVNNSGEIVDVYDQNIGIKDHVCASVNSLRNSVWCALGMGISRFEYSSPFRYFSEESDVEGFIVDVVHFKNNLFVATETGLFFMEEGKNKTYSFNKIEGIESQIRSMCKMSFGDINLTEFIIIGTTDGIYVLKDKLSKPQLIEKNIVGIEKYANIDPDKVKDQDVVISISAIKLFPEKKSNKLWVGTTSKLMRLEFKNNRWYITDDIYDVGDAIDVIVKDNDDNIWASTMQSGLVRIDKNKNIERYNTESGLPFNHSLTVFNSPDDILCGTPKGIYRFDIDDSIFKIDSLFPKKYTDGMFGISEMMVDKKGNYYFNYYSEENKGVDKLIWNTTTGKYDIVDDFKRLGNIDINCFYEEEDFIWFGISDVLYNYNKNVNVDLTDSYKCLIRKVEGFDSTYFNGAFYKETPQGLKSSNIQHENQKPVLRFTQNDITFHFAAPYYEGAEAIKYSYKLEGFKEEWSKWNEEAKAVFTNLNEGQYIFKVKALNIYENESEIGTYSFIITPPWYRTILAYVIYVIFGLLAVWIIVKLYTRRLEQEKIALEGIVRERTSEIREQRDEIAGQKQSIEDSILYARRIQRAILPSEELASEILPEHFILFRPRDVVSGDYFWMNKIGNKVVLVAADCTGHGVPGAFMSMLGVSFLNEIVLKENIIEPHLILNKLRTRVKNTLKQEGKAGEAKDGMDVALVMIDYDAKKLYFSGAYNPLYIYKGAELHEIKADRMPIGIFIKEKESFTLNEYDYKPGDTFYIFSDGYPDQFGGPKNQKFRTKTMKQLLSDIQKHPMPDQHEILNTTIEKWMAESVGQDQIDDMVIIGVRM